MFVLRPSQNLSRRVAVLLAKASPRNSTNPFTQREEFDMAPHKVVDLPMLVLEDVQPFVHWLEPIQVAVRFCESHVDYLMPRTTGNLLFCPPCHSYFKDTR